MIKAIETRYAGCRFRSRLEARWAVFFDQLGIRWEYEHQGWVLTHPHDGQEFTYLPDFWLPEVTTWIEVKGGTFGEISPADEAKCTIFAMARWIERERFRLLWNLPRQIGEDLPIGHAMRQSQAPGIACVVFSSMPAGDFEQGKRVLPGDLSGTPAWLRAAWVPDATYADVAAALTTARSARFEHGQSGA